MTGFATVPTDLMGAFQLIPYSSAEDAVFKALGVELGAITGKNKNLSNKTPLDLKKEVIRLCTSPITSIRNSYVASSNRG